jgi:hypothetical protein
MISFNRDLVVMMPYFEGLGLAVSGREPGRDVKGCFASIDTFDLAAYMV